MPRKMAREPNIEAPDTAPTPAKKIDMVIALLRREQGASLDELVQATAWLPHTTRAALTGLKKKGHVIGKAKVDGVTRYSIASAAVL
jgi:hypothetical protein